MIGIKFLVTFLLIDDDYTGKAENAIEGFLGRVCKDLQRLPLREPFLQSKHNLAF